MPTALVTGISGQDGSYLAELLLAKGYTVHGVSRLEPRSNLERIEHLRSHQRFELHYVDLGQSATVGQLLSLTEPDEIYNLASQSQVKLSFDRPLETIEANGLGCVRLLEAVRAAGRPRVKFFQAGSSELFGTAEESPQSERTRFRPQNPYASAKALAFFAVQNYRDAYGMFAANGILFNHESPRRPANFVTRKITRAAARIKLGLERELALGNLDASRDFGHARDYVEAMWRMLQADRPHDFVVATGVAHTVREFAAEAFGYLGLDFTDFVRIDPSFFRPVDANAVVGDSSALRRTLGWEPKTSFRELVREMVDFDLELARRESRAAPA